MQVTIVTMSIVALLTARKQPEYVYSRCKVCCQISREILAKITGLATLFSGRSTLCNQLVTYPKSLLKTLADPCD